jgi:hypothetical protein
MRRRFFLDAGSGVCLWAQDAEAKARFGYRVVSRELDIPEDLRAQDLRPQDLRAETEQLATDHDATFACDDPGSGDILAPSRTMSGYEENTHFATRVRVLLPALQAARPGFAIGSDWEAQASTTSPRPLRLSDSPG